MLQCFEFYNAEENHYDRRTYGSEKHGTGRCDDTRRRPISSSRHFLTEIMLMDAGGHSNAILAIRLGLNLIDECK